MPFKAFEVEGLGKVTIYKRRASRSLRLTLAPGGGVRVSIPVWAPYEAGLRFAASKKAWIAANNQPAPAQLTSGMMIGKTRRLTFVADPDTVTVKTSVRSNEVVVWHNPRLDQSHSTVQRAAELASYRALKSEAVKRLTPRLNELAARHDFAYRSLAFKRMKTRWGSCDQRQNIVLNIFLTQLPEDCVNYVILHELTHTRVLHHGTDFWQAMDQVLPDARSYKRAMRTHQPTLQSVSPTVA